jgi:ABC-type transport system substrate-binding protein
LKIFRGTLGYIGNLGKHSDTKVDDLLWQARAATTPADVKAAYKAVTAEIQSQALFTSVVNFRWAFVTNNKSKLAGVGTLQVVKGKKVRPVTAQGADWAGLHKG